LSWLGAIRDYAGRLAQPDALLRPAFHRRVVSRPGEQEVLNTRQVVSDLTVHSLHAVFEMVAHDPPEQRENMSLVYRGRQSLALGKRKAPRGSGARVSLRKETLPLPNRFAPFCIA
jgi:hypothetical protein